jgi:hypothetical protein
MTDAAMPKLYRIYTIGSDGGFAGLPRIVECSDDEEAVAEAMKANDSGYGVEIWNSTKMVAHLPQNAPKVWGPWRLAGESKKAI